MRSGQRAMAPLESAAAAFRLLTSGPGPLSLDGREVGP